VVAAAAAAPSAPSNGGSDADDCRRLPMAGFCLFSGSFDLPALEAADAAFALEAFSRAP